jgi:hypothetical protein
MVATRLLLPVTCLVLLLMCGCGSSPQVIDGCMCVVLEQSPTNCDRTKDHNQHVQLCTERRTRKAYTNLDD